MTALRQYQAGFTQYIRAPIPANRPDGVNARRIKVYAELVLTKMKESVSACFPVAREVLGERRWNRLLRAFLGQHACATPIFRQIPEEFLAWLEQAGNKDIPPWLPSLAHYEWVELALAVSDAPDIPAGKVDGAGDLLEGRPVLAPVLMLLSYPYAVHRISKRYKPAKPDAEPTHILAFRREHFEVKFMEVNAVSARLVALLRESRMSGREALLEIAAEMRHPKPEVVVAGGKQILESLRQERALLGTVKS